MKSQNSGKFNKVWFVIAILFILMSAVSGTDKLGGNLALLGGGIALLIKSFIPPLTAGRGFCVCLGGIILFPSFFDTYMMISYGQGKSMFGYNCIIMDILGLLLLFFGFRPVKKDSVSKEYEIEPDK